MFNFFSRRLTLGLDDFHRLLARDAPRWYSVCLRITKDACLAEDAVQEALLKAWAKRSQFRAEADMSTWIHRIAVHCALDVLRKQRPETFNENPHLTDPAAQVPSAFAQQQSLAAMSTANAALAILTDLERVCFVLKHWEDYRLEEIAIELNCSIDRVKQALFRAVRKLRTELSDWQHQHLGESE